jgi:hypothetical protein
MNASGDALLLFLALIAGPPPAQDPALFRTLGYTIMAQGLPCGKVVSARAKPDRGHIALCADGSRYRISVDAQGLGVARKI